MGLSTIPIPDSFSRRISRISGGRDWLARVPELVEARLTEWDLELDLVPGQLPWNGHGALVVPVKEKRNDDDGTAVLKIAFPHAEATVEAAALRLWGGNGSVRLLREDPASCTLLLERLGAEWSLQKAPMDLAAQVWGGLVRQLSLVPDHRPEWNEFEHIAALAERFSDELPADWEMLGRPFPRWLLEAALEVCQTRGAVGRRFSKDVLVHTDFHYLNILARVQDSGSPAVEDYLAIDPQAMIGEAEFGVAPLLWNRIGDLSPAGPEAALVERCEVFSLVAGLDPDVSRQWAIVREVENALSYASQPAHRGDFQRSLWVAGTMAGRQVPGLPAALTLPEPGEA
ncbi:aminoglycoside phosphotransferase family protein [Pseudarthrobacter sp. J1738]|uniref:aminoglycoside phosphotransferase family protein n=1 Tax=Pseudarthrobacter sp. J1738 TaxID=3420446 RepID=UPI003D2B0CEB